MFGGTGDFTEKGVRDLEGFKALDHLEITSDDVFSNEVVEGVRRELPSVSTFKVMP